MDILGVIIRFSIAALFFVAGISKLANVRRTKESILQFGAPEWTAGGISIFIPTAEILVGLLLIFSNTALYGIIGVIVLLLLFSAAIAWNLAKGHKPNCNCFGQIKSTPINKMMLVKNAVMLFSAMFLLWIDIAYSSASIGELGIFSSIQPVYVLLLFAVFLSVVEGVLIYHLLQQSGRLLIRMDTLEIGLTQGSVNAFNTHNIGLPIGSSAPRFELTSLTTGQMILFKDLIRGPFATILIFSDPDCGPCNSLLPDIERWEKDFGKIANFALISRGSIQENRLKVGVLSISYILLQKDREVAEMYRVTATPSAQVIGEDGRIRSNLAIGPQAIEELVLEYVKYYSTQRITATAL
ncbi:MAG: MauE/DoxX family redox-associated membrane protein [Geminicoccaceae bacterium]